MKARKRGSKTGVEAWSTPGRVFSALEREFKGELDLPLGAESRALQFAEVAIGEVIVRVDELWSIGQVEELRPELQVVALPEQEVLECREVKITDARSNQEVAGRGPTAQLHPGRVLRDRGKGSGIEVLIGGGDAAIRSAHQVRTYRWVTTVVIHVKRRAAVGGIDQVDLPSSQYGVLETVPVRAVLHTPPERQRVQASEHKAVAEVEVRAGLLRSEVAIVDDRALVVVERPR